MIAGYYAANVLAIWVYSSLFTISGSRKNK